MGNKKRKDLYSSKSGTKVRYESVIPGLNLSPGRIEFEQEIMKSHKERQKRLRNLGKIDRA